ncbi:Uncharacterised protein [Mycobacteroides abscessus subsp. bolletii]|uniref:hypothetical protein n=1 Tax=Mycobacteroides abscessus TaxID=36809 RepID=UPI0005E9E0D8|nr:hypothetical protein [Mycobacteroides abscessus]CPW93759.1 Uncharacterised protein [Mycobacteroides abscessus]SKF62157.1 Uncharacterised protein [Mycobacteroides abscessus subsp. bolletii]SKH96616.1 Uncharacterised protein [Mycobacteroides abscessus subsp. bolletii]
MADQTKWLTEYQKLAAEIAEHNARNPGIDPTGAYNLEALQLNDQLVALQTEAWQLQLPDVPIKDLQRPG